MIVIIMTTINAVHIDMFWHYPMMIIELGNAEAYCIHKYQNYCTVSCYSKLILLYSSAVTLAILNY